MACPEAKEAAPNKLDEAGLIGFTLSVTVKLPYCLLADAMPESNLFLEEDAPVMFEDW
jgi:hypothetical protein